MPISKLPGSLRIEANPLNWESHFKFGLPSQLESILNIQKTSIGDKPCIYVKYQDIGTEKIRSTELWVHPQQAYRTIKGIESQKSVTALNSSNPYERIMTQIYYSSQLIPFEHGIWFPQVVSEEWKIVPIEKQKKPLPYYTSRKKTLQVHRAAFNIPIEEKDLRITPDK